MQCLSSSISVNQRLLAVSIFHQVRGDDASVLANPATYRFRPLKSEKNHLVEVVFVKPTGWSLETFDLKGASSAASRDLQQMCRIGRFGKQRNKLKN